MSFGEGRSPLDLAFTLDDEHVIFNLNVQVFRIEILRQLIFFRKMCNSQPLFLYFCLFNTVDSKQMFHIKVCQCLDLNRGPLVSEAVALPIEPQSLPKKTINSLVDAPMR